MPFLKEAHDIFHLRNSTYTSKYVSNLHFTIVRMLKMGTIYVRGFCYLEFLTVFQKVYGDVYFENIRRTKFTAMNV